MANDPIFIVGTPRSGTTLLASMLASHSRIACGTETHFFSYLAKYSEDIFLSDNRWPEMAVRFISSLTIEGYKVCELFGITIGELEIFLKNRKPSVSAMLESLTQPYSNRLGKVRWIEKTPRHLLHLSAIRQWYQHARIIRIIRDPRDTVLSMQKVPWASHSVIANVYRWVDDDHKSFNFFKKDQNSIIIRYEDLILNTKLQLERICEFVGEKFEPGMENPQEVAHGLIGKEEWWKKQVTRPVDSSRVGVWKRELSDKYARAASCIAYDELKKYGYEISCKPQQIVNFFPLTNKFIEENEELFIRAADVGVRFKRCSTLSELCDTIKLREISGIAIVGRPGQNGWNIGTTSLERLMNAMRFGITLVTWKFRGKPALRFCYGKKSKEIGKSERFCEVILKKLSQRSSNNSFLYHNRPITKKHL